MIVTIDGPAGAGKSSVSRLLAERLDFQFLDTGAMYRAATLAVLRANVDCEDQPRLRQIAMSCDIQVQGTQVILNGEDVSEEIRTSEVTSAIKHVADDPAIREWIVKCQRKIAHGTNIVTEGRDQGTVAFPYSKCKIYLTATPGERARRRVEDFRNANEPSNYDEVLIQINLRDMQDMARPVGALKKARDAYELLTDGMSLEEVIDKLEDVARQRMAESTEG